MRLGLFFGGTGLLFGLGLMGCLREPRPPARPTPAVVDESWWHGEWALDLSRLDAPPMAHGIAAQIAPSARYNLSPSALERTVADTRRVEAWRVRGTSPARVTLQVSDARQILIERDAEGVWLVDGAARLPIVRPDSD